MKIAVILNSKSDLPTQINAAAHLCVGLQDIVERSALDLRRFHDASGSHVSTLTDFPLIVFSARNGEHLKSAHREALELGVPCNAFFDCMRSADPEAQEAFVGCRSVAEQDYIGIALLGSSERLRPLTRRFSLLRASGNAQELTGGSAVPG